MYVTISPSSLRTASPYKPGTTQTSAWHGLVDAKDRANSLVEMGRPWAIVVDEQTGVVLYRAGIPVTQPAIPQNEEVG